MILRKYQTSALDQVRREISKGVKAVVLMLATGGGKTAIASEIARSALAKGNRVFFVVDSIELIDQAYNRFTADGMECGIIQGQHWLTDYSKPVQVATIQTLRKRWEVMPDDLKPAVLIIDECHVCHEAHKQIINECKFKGWVVLGLSATPFRKGLGQVFDSLVIGATTQSLTDEGFLVPARCYAPYIPNLKGIKTSGGDWKAEALGELMGDAVLVGDVVTQWRKHGQGRRTIVFAATVAHSRLLCDEFNRQGIRAGHIDGYERDPEVREETIRDFRSGQIEVLCNVAVLTKGFDCPEVSCVVIARPTKSLMLHIQMLGRGLRTSPETGKTDCVVIDHAGNVLRNGLPTDDLPTELDDGKLDYSLDRKEREKTEPVPKPCGSCGHISTKHKCPVCGFAPQHREGVEVVDGDLYEIEQGTEKWGTKRKQRFYAELLGYAEQKGYASGWAWHKCREYLGTAPKNTGGLGNLAPSQETLNVIKHLNIRNAKRRQAA